MQAAIRKLHEQSYSIKGIGMGCGCILLFGLTLVAGASLFKAYLPGFSTQSTGAYYRYIFFLTLFAGGIWSGLLLSLFPKPLGFSTVVVALGALVLGWLSTIPTLASMSWLDSRLNLSEGNDFLSDFLYHLFSVGLREELCKLLLFTPLLILVLRKNRDLEALILGAFVGLGFAIEENITYFIQYQFTGVAVSRFVSANFLHLTLTGVTSLALTRSLRDPKQWWADSLQMILYAIALHAVYNALLSQPVPGFGDMGYFSGTALAGCAYLFFREVQSLAPPPKATVSRTALFCWGFCLLFLLELLLTSLTLPFDVALFILGQSALAGVFTAYIFIHQIRETLSP
jgi:RsiW-degrading membrane proteinase PrsW (M82 family)